MRKMHACNWPAVSKTLQRRGEAAIRIIQNTEAARGKSSRKSSSSKRFHLCEREARHPFAGHANLEEGHDIPHRSNFLPSLMYDSDCTSRRRVRRVCKSRKRVELSILRSPTGWCPRLEQA